MAAKRKNGKILGKRKTPIDRGTIGFNVFVYQDGFVKHVCESIGSKGDNGSRKEYRESVLPLLLEGNKVLILGDRGYQDAHAATMPPRGAIEKAELFLHQKSIFGGFGLVMWADDQPSNDDEKESSDLPKPSARRVPRRMFDIDHSEDL